MRKYALISLGERNPRLKGIRVCVWVNPTRLVREEILSLWSLIKTMDEQSEDQQKECFRRLLDLLVDLWNGPFVKARSREEIETLASGLQVLDPGAFAWLFIRSCELIAGQDDQPDKIPFVWRDGPVQ